MPPIPRRSRKAVRSLLWAAAPLAAGCADAADAGSTLEVVRDTVGDTIVVRTVAGSAWNGPAELVPEVAIGVLEDEEHYMFGQLRSLAVGNDGTIFVMDGQIPAVRVFAPDGTYRTTLGRDGGGPGEFSQPDGGMAWLSDGRLVVRDPGNGRLQVFGPDLEPAGTWPVIRGRFNTSNPMFVGPGDTLLTPVLMDTEMDISEWRSGLQRVDPATGEIVDTLPVPDTGYEAPRLEARITTDGGESVSINSVPFSPDESWTYHSHGYFVYGISTDYRLTLLRPDGAVRIERVAEPVPVAPGERSEAEAQATRNMRGTDPNWRWNGPSIPDHKPPYARFWAARDGRIWVRVARAGVEADDPDYDPADPDDVEDRWSDPIAFDVFEADGTYLGRVDAPADLSLYPTPIFDGDLVWAVTRDDFDVQRIVRFRVRRSDEVLADAG